MLFRKRKNKNQDRFDDLYERLLDLEKTCFKNQLRKSKKAIVEAKYKLEESAIFISNETYDKVSPIFDKIEKNITFLSDYEINEYLEKAINITSNPYSAGVDQQTRIEEIDEKTLEDQRELREIDSKIKYHKEQQDKALKDDDRISWRNHTSRLKKFQQMFNMSDKQFTDHLNHLANLEHAEHAVKMKVNSQGIQEDLASESMMNYQENIEHVKETQSDINETTDTFQQTRDEYVETGEADPFDKAREDKLLNGDLDDDFEKARQRLLEGKDE